MTKTMDKTAGEEKERKGAEEGRSKREENVES